MVGIKRSISLFPILTAILLLVGMRSVPHHHSNSSDEEIHFGAGECCGHSGKEEGGTANDHTTLNCCGISDIYVKAHDNSSDTNKRDVELSIHPFLPINHVSAVLTIGERLWCDCKVFNLQQVQYYQCALRAPPVV